MRTKDGHIYTGFIDEKGDMIYVGDLLESEDGYTVMVCQHKDNGDFYGSLNCEIGDSCRNIPYTLNFGHGYTKIYGYRSSNYSENDE